MNLVKINGGNPNILATHDIGEEVKYDNNFKEHKDKRGIISRVDCDSIKFNVMTTKSGYYRGGEIHPNSQFNMVLSGRIDIFYLVDGKNIWQQVMPNTLVIIEPYIPHLFYFVEDSVMLEWWDGPMTGWYYPDFRKYVKYE